MSRELLSMSLMATELSSQSETLSLWESFSAM